MNRSSKLNKQEIREILALSPTQEGMLYHYLKNPVSKEYSEQLCLHLSGELDMELVQQAWRSVIASNDTLRTFFAWKTLQNPVQIVLHQVPLALQELDLTAVQEERERQTLLAQIRQDDLVLSFDLEKGPLFRVTVVRLPDQQAEMILHYHHIILDGWSTGVILKEFFTALATLTSGGRLQPVQKSPLRKYLKWLKERDQVAEKRYWQAYLADVESKSSLPADFLKTGEISHIDNHEVIIPPKLAEEIKRFAKQENVTVAALFNCCWGLFLQKFNNSSQAVFGTVVSGRPPEIAGIEEMAGLLLNTVPVRFSTERGETIRELIRRINADAIQRKPYEYCSLVEMKNLQQQALEDSLFDSLLVVENYPLEEVIDNLNRFSPLIIESYSIFEMTNYDLTIVLSLFDQMKINMIYNADLFAFSTIAQVVRRLLKIMEELLKQPETEVAAIELLTPGEQEMILAWNQPEQIWAQAKPLYRLLEDRAAQTPDRVAIVAGPRSITYRELNEKANRLARILQRQGAGREKIVAIMAEPSEEMLTGIFAIGKAGAAYLPIAPNLPEVRIHYMLTDSRTQILLTQSKVLQQAYHPVETINLDQHISDLENPANLTMPQSLNDLAYVIYTSGSTGNPKGVLVEHGSLYNTLAGLQEQYPLGSGDRWLLKTTFTFDVSLTELFGWVLGGGSVAILESGGEKEPGQILEAIATYEITHINFVPSMLTLFVDYLEGAGAPAVAILNKLKYLMVAGEAIYHELVQRFFQLTTEVAFINLYGPTEAAIYATHFDLKDAHHYRTVPVGKGVANTRLYIVDQDHHLQPVGFPGELWIGGPGVARGYLNKLELTQDKFVPDVFQPATIGRLYRTGDLAAWLPDGNIEFLGRLDHQVKIRGYRIELGEIEAQLLTHPQIHQAVVLAQGESPDKVLIAYYVAMAEIAWAELHAYLAEKLPGYMVPAYYVRIEEMPLTQSGKIDRKALPAFTGELLPQTLDAAPANPVEVRLVQIWSELLGLNQVGIQQDFFMLGGHSLNATKLVSRIYKEFQVVLPLKAVFEARTIKQQAEYIRRVEKQQYYQIAKALDQEYYPVSSAQKRLFLLHELHPHSTAYNMSALFKIEGEFSLERCEDVFRRLLERHESFRTAFALVEGQVMQRIIPAVPFVLARLDAHNCGLEQRVQEFIKPFDLAQAPLLRAGVITSGNVLYLIIDLHHIISDGESLGILIGEFVQLYQQQELPEVRIQYRDYAVWQNELLQSDLFAAQKAHWQKTFADEVVLLDLPTDYPRPVEMTAAGASLGFELDAELTAQLQQIAIQHNVTLYMLLLALFNALLAKYSGQEDILVGSPVAGRVHSDLEQTTGMFVNTLVMRNYPAGAKSFAAFLAEVRENALLAYQNQDYPFEMVIEDLVLASQGGRRNPLLDVMFVFQDRVESRIELDSLCFVAEPLSRENTKFDLTFSAMEQDGQIACEFEYSTELFCAERMIRMSRHFMNVVQTVIADLGVRLGEIRMITDEEARQILVEFNDTLVDYPLEKTVHQLFTEQATRTPEQVALVYHGQALTYWELNKRANQLARVLRSKGVRRDQAVGIMVERSVEMVVGVLAILKAGSAYLPVEADYPAERVQFMLQDAGVALVLCTEQTGAVLEGQCGYSYEVLNLNDECLYKGDGDELEDVNDSEDLIYIIYTSGSTGKAKGVMVTHRNVVKLIVNSNMLKIRQTERIMPTGPLAFDASTFEIWGTMLNGATLYLIDKTELLSVQKVERFMQENQITMIWLTSSLFNYLFDENPEIFAGLATLYVGGDVLSVKHINALRARYPHLTVVNGYGPTENTTFTTYYPVSETHSGHIPIGRPVSNTQVIIVDAYNQLQPVGVSGELWIAGSGLARGYLNRPELTAEKFVQNPFAPMGIVGERMYRTGDLARWLPDGRIEFLGRIDQQVKIRGFRIEPGEIEVQLLKNPAILEATVIPRQSSDGNKYLAAYFVAESTLQSAAIKEALRKELPEYMIPAYFVQLEALPLNSNGKVHRAALPEPDLSSAVRQYDAPTNEIEEKLAGIFSQVLGVNQVGINDDFFELGGHSLKATACISRVYKELQVEIPLKQMFETPTTKALAKWIAAREEKKYAPILPVAESTYYPVSSAQKRLFILQQLAGAGTSYNIPVAMVIEGPLEIAVLEAVFKKLIRRHESLRTSFDLVEGEIVQRIAEDVEFWINSSPYFCHKEELADIVQKFIQPFDLSKAPLLRVALTRLASSAGGKDRYLLVMDMHHIISDGTSMNVLVQEIADLYQDRQLPELGVQYKDFAAWQNGLLGSEAIQRQEAYWLSQFDGEIPVLDLPTDYQRPAVKSFAGDSVKVVIEKEMVERLYRLAHRTRTTLYMVLLAAYNVLLARYSGQEDSVVGAPVAGRAHPDLEKMIGMFVNTLPIRNYPAKSKLFSQFLAEVKEQTLQTFENQDYQFEMLVEKLDLAKDMSRNPLFETIFVLQNMARAEIHLNDLHFTPVHWENGTTKFDLALNAEERNGEIECIFSYSTKLFKQATIQRLSRHFLKIVKAVLVEPDVQLSAIEIVTDEERQQLVREFNRTQRAYPDDRIIIQLLEAQVERIPEQIAVKHSGGALTYRELNARSNQLARYLVAKGVGPEQITGIMLERSVEMLVAIMAIYKAGGAYLPISPDLPEQRIDFILRDSGARIVLSREEYSLHLQTQVEIVHLSEFPYASYDDTNLASTYSAHDLAYVIYTSGSTGNPKGVLVEQGNLLNILYSLQEDYPVVEGDCWLLKTTFMFDVSVSEIFGWILGGSSVALAEAGVEKEPKRILEAIERYKVTHINFVPSMLNLFLEYIELEGGRAVEILSQLKYLLVAGEAISHDQVQRLYRLTRDVEFVNLYGPTEATIYATQFALQTAGQYKSVPIGKGVANTTLYILAEGNTLQPIGVPGELCIGGKGVARGYLQRPELTSAKFVQDSFEGSKGRMYRTGDLAAWLPDGNIEYRGRIDHQVKIRGYRIEPGEIEAILVQDGSIKQALVIPHKGRDHQYDLVAYLVLDHDVDVKSLRENLRQKLPDYMIPAYFMQVTMIPLTANGKINRGALPLPDQSSHDLREYVAPTNELEEKLARIFSEVLEVDRVSIYDDFFAFGGHSLKATALIFKAYRELGVEIPLKQIFDTPTIQELAKWTAATAERRFASIQRVTKGAYYPVSSAQKRLFILQQLEGAGTSYNLPLVILLEGPLNIAALEDVFKQLIRRHESLRTSFAVVDGEIVQRIAQDVEFTIDYRLSGELGACADHGTSSNMRSEVALDVKIMQAILEFIRPFDLRQAPLLRVGLLKIVNAEVGAMERHILVMDMHHIISDGTSLNVLMQEIADLYQDRQLPELGVQYKDFAAWQNDLLGSEAIRRQEAYWLSQFDGEIPVLDLPTDYQRPAVKSFAGDSVKVVIEKEMVEQLDKLSHSTRTTLYMVLLAAYNVLLARYSGQEDIVVGAPVAGRAHPDLEKMIGMFVNTLPVRNYPAKSKLFSQFLAEVKEQTLQTFENQDYQFEMLVEKLDLAKDMSRNLLFETIFVLQNMARAEIHLNDLHFTPVHWENGTTKFDLALNAEERNGEIECIFSYSTKLFKQATIQRLSRHFLKIVKAVLVEPDVQLSAIEIVTGEERQQLVRDFNRTQRAYPDDRIIIQLLEAQVERIPEQIAVKHSGGALTYRELNARSNQLARYLVAKGVGPEQITGIMLERSVEMLVAIMAIFKAGGAYLPISPDLPEQRIDFILRDSGTQIVLSREEYSLHLQTQVEIVHLSEFSYASYDDTNLASTYSAHDLAYVIYTSGSTGNPKGVLVEQGNLLNILYSLQEDYPVVEGDCWLLKTTFMFDVSVSEIFGWILGGSSVALPEAGVEKEPKRILEAMERYKVTHINFVPSMLNLFLEYIELEGGRAVEILSQLKYLLVAGEAISHDQVQRLYRLTRDVEFVNLYGPTEATIYATQFALQTAGQYKSVPIGKGVANTTLYILAEGNTLQPIGVPGELCIGGKGVARGYLQRPELTSAKFVQDSFEGSKGMMYRTGDLAAWLPDGNIEYRGRIDHQVKIRGYRVELGEIEARLSLYPQIKEVTVLVRGVGAEEDLIAYYVADDAIDLAEIRHHLREELPEYMIPAYFVQVEAMPLTSNGKINRKALPEFTGQVDTGVDYEKPAGEVEERLAAIWTDLLGVEKIGVKDNFFTLGGHSLKATALISKLYHQLHVEIPLQQVFNTPTIRELANYIKTATAVDYSAIKPVALREYYPLSSAQRRMFIMQQLEEDNISYNLPDAVLIEGALDVERLHQAFVELIRRHETLRTSFEMVDGEPVQRIIPEVDFAIDFAEASVEMVTLEKVLDQMIADFVRPFELQKPPLLRVKLIRLLGASSKYFLIFDMHHIISDGVSMSIMLQEIAALYQQQPLPELKIQYKDFAAWQSDLFFPERFKKQEEYWLQRFQGELPVLNLPTDFARPMVQSFAGDTVYFVLDANLTASLQALILETGTTLYIVLLAIYTVLLFKHSGQEDIIVGSPITGRTHPDLEDVMGMFVNMLSMRNYPRGEMTFAAFLQEVKENALNAFAHQEYQFEELVRRLEIKRDSSRNPVFTAVLAMQNITMKPLDVQEFTMVPYQRKIKISIFDLLLNVTGRGEEIDFWLIYKTSLFKQSTIEDLTEDFQIILQQVIEKPEINLQEIKLPDRYLLLEPAKIAEDSQFNF